MTQEVIVTRELFDHSDPENIKFKLPQGITKEVVIAISKYKNEPEWMLNLRLKAFEIFEKLPTPEWGPDLSDLDLSKITYFAVPDSKSNSTNWDELPKDIKKTFERLGIPEAEQKEL
ncbi:MAG: Fe-S cluster assembly protein SufB, partial [Nanoarchaeota archaeon]